MKVLSLVTNRYASFYQNQVEALNSSGIDLNHISPRKQSPDYGVRQGISRSVFDYARMYPTVFRESMGEYDLIHANNGKTAPFALAQLSRPIVLTLWGSDLMGSLNWLSKYSAEYFDEVILPSPAMESYINSSYTIVPFGIDTNVFSPIPKDRARDLVGWDKDSTVVLFPYPKSRTIKNFPLAKKIVDQIKSAELRNMADVPHERVPVYMNASDCVLITSKRESGPMVIKEAALCNVPVVSTDVGFASEVLSDVENSYVCSSEKELKDRLEAVIDSGERSNGRKHADEWGLERMGERLIDVYESVLEK